MAGSKSSGSDRDEARAVDYVKTSQEAEAELERKAAEEKPRRRRARAVHQRLTTARSGRATSWNTQHGPRPDTTKASKCWPLWSRAERQRPAFAALVYAEGS